MDLEGLTSKERQEGAGVKYEQEGEMRNMGSSVQVSTMRFSSKGQEFPFHASFLVIAQYKLVYLMFTCMWCYRVLVWCKSLLARNCAVLQGGRTNTWTLFMPFNVAEWHLLYVVCYWFSCLHSTTARYVTNLCGDFRRLHVLE